MSKIMKIFKIGSGLFIIASTILNLFSFHHKVDEEKEKMFKCVSMILSGLALVFTIGTVGFLIKEDRDIKRIESRR